MSFLGPKSMHDMDGWYQIDCVAFQDGILGAYQGLPDDVFRVESSLSDPGGRYGKPVTFSEWWINGRPLLRDYREDDGCRHYRAIGPSAAAEIE